MSQKVVASIEARMNASRLPGKVLKPLGGKPALTQMLDRVRRSRLLDDIVIATTDSPRDDEIYEWSISEGVACYRGSEDDVLDRVRRAQELMGSEIVVELCGDCPLLEPAVIDLAITEYRESGADLVSTVIEPQFPGGIDVEVFSVESLEWVAENVSDLSVREHVSLYFYQHPDRYLLRQLTAPKRWWAPKVRLLLDYPEDLVLLTAVFDTFANRSASDFGLDDVLKELGRNEKLNKLHDRCLARVADG